MGERLSTYVRRHRFARCLGRAAIVAGLTAALAAGYAAAAGTGGITVFNIGLPGGNEGYRANGIAAGSDGGLWFDAGSTIADSLMGRIAPSGSISEFSAGLNAGSNPDAMAAGPDGSVWFADLGTDYAAGFAIGRITPSGTITEIPTANVQPRGVAFDPAGDIWFTGGRAIGKLTPTGQITEYPVDLHAYSSPYSIVAGPDGAMWFTDMGSTPAIGRITTDGTITEYTTGLNPGSDPWEIAVGPDGAMWFTDEGSTQAIGRITTDGTITEFSAGLSAGSSPRGIAAAPDGNMWFTAPGASSMLGEITPNGTITEFSTGSEGLSYPDAIATGPDGGVWFTAYLAGFVAAIGRMDVGAPAASVAPPQINGSGRQGDEQVCGGALWSDWAGQQPSTSAFPFDGYQWLLDGNAITGQTAQPYTPNAADVGHLLSCKLTATYTLFPATVSATSTAVAVLPAAVVSGGGGGGGGDGGGSVYPDLKLVLTSDSTLAPPVGLPLVYRVAVSDRPLTYGATQVFVDVTLPAGYAVTSTYADRGTGCTVAAPGLVCNLDWISPDVVGHIIITGTVGTAGPQVASATVRHWLEEGNPADDTMSLTLSLPGTTSSGGGPSGGVSASALTRAAIAGKGRVGSVLRAKQPQWSATPSLVSYRWQLCTPHACSTIRHATKPTLTVLRSYAGRDVRVLVTATIGGKAVTSTSATVHIAKH